MATDSEQSVQRARRVVAVAALLLVVSTCTLAAGHDRLPLVGPMPRPLALAGGFSLCVALASRSRWLEVRASLLSLGLGIVGALDLALGGPIGRTLGGPLIWAPACAALLLLSGSLLAPWRPFAQPATLLTGVASMVPIIDRLYRGALGAPAPFTREYSPTMSLVAFALVAAALIRHREWPVVARARSAGIAGVLIRRVLPLTVASVLAFGALVLVAERYGLAPGTLAHTLLATLSAAAAGATILTVTAHIDALDKARETALADALAQREFMQRVIDELPLAVVVKDASTLRYTLANTRAQRLLGSSNVVGQRLDAFRPDLAERAAARDRRVVETGEGYELDDQPYETPEGHGYARVRSIPLCDGAGQVVSLLGLIEDVTQRAETAKSLRQAIEDTARANRALEDAKGTLDAFVDALPVAAFALERSSGRFLRLNRRGRELGRHAGRTVGTGTALAEVLPEPLAARLVEGIERCVVEQEFSIDYEVQGPDQLLVLRTRLVPLRAGDEEVTTILGTTEDLTSERRAAAELRAAKEQAERALEERATSERFLDMVLEELPNPVFVKDAATGRYLRTSRVFGRELHLDAREAPGKTNAELFPAPLAARFDELDQEALLRGAVEIPAMRIAQDPPRWVQTTIRAIRPAEGQVYLVGASTEITAEREATEAIRRSAAAAEAARRELAEQKEFLSLILDNLTVAVLVADADLRFVLANQRAADVVLLDPQAMIGRRPRDLLPEGRARLMEERLLRMGSHDAVAEADLHRESPEGTRIFHTRRRVVRDAHGAPRFYIATAEDVTQSRATAEALRQAKESAEAANRELEAFSYSVSHDLRAPLRAIDGFSMALLEDCGDGLDEQGKDHLRRVRAAAQRMSDLIEDLLRLSRVNRVELVVDSVDLSLLASEVVEELRSGDPQRAIDVHVASGITVQGDRRLLRVALANLLGNAWKFTRKCERPRIAVSAVVDRGEVTVEIGDNGAGFDMAYADKLFKPFRRLHAATDYPGTGIGLATVQRVVHRHGGRVWAESELGRGARFWLTLPDGE